MRNSPRYAINSVDHALRLALLLRHEGPVRGADAAERLGIARSTAHRLLAMLVHWDFAEQRDDRTYAPGPVWRHGDASGEASVSAARIRAVALPHLRELTRVTGETSNVQILLGTNVRFLVAVESTQVLRVGDREGRLLPAHLASGGKAILAGLPADRRARHLAAGVDVEALARELRAVRRRGFAINDQATERGVTAIGRVVRNPDGAPVAAVSLALPSLRFRRAALPRLTAPLGRAATAIGGSLADAARG
jgi:DNA-binding IclR family transcriptional regulator